MTRAGKTAQQVKALAVKPEDLNRNPRTLLVEARTDYEKLCADRLAVVCTYACVHTK